MRSPKHDWVEVKVHHGPDLFTSQNISVRKLESKIQFPAVVHEGQVPLLTLHFVEVAEPHCFGCRAAYTGT